MGLCMQVRTSAKLSTSGRERELQSLQAAHEQAETKLKADIQKKNSLLSSCRADAEHLRAEIQSLKAEQNLAAEGHAQTAEALQEQALTCQKVAGCILRCLGTACRLTLRSSAAMRAGEPPSQRSVSASCFCTPRFALAPALLCCDYAFSVPARCLGDMHCTAGSMTMGNTTVYMRACTPSEQLHAGDVASLVGLSTQEVSDLLGTSIQDVTSVVAGGSATVSHVAKVLGTVHDLLTTTAGK